VIVAADLKLLLSYLGFTLWISSALTVGSLFVLRRQLAEGVTPVWGYPYVPGLYVSLTLVLAAIAGSREPVQLAAALVTIASGSLAFFLLERTRRHR
jgi:hypothetical protein